MARPVPIGEYQPQIPVEEGLRRIIPQRSGISTGPALQEFGESLQKVAQSEAAQYATQTLSKAQSDWTQHLIERQESAQPGAPGFTQSLMKDYQDYVGKTVKDAPSLAGRMLSQQLTMFGHQLSQKALLFEANARQAHNETTAKDSIDSTSAELMNDPSVYSQRVTERQTLINGMNLDPQVKEKLSDYAQHAMAAFSVRGDINRDPYSAMLALQDKEAKGYYSNLTAEQREQLMDHADRMLHQRVSDAERVHQIAKQEQQEASDGLLKQGIVMSTRGQLTPAWVVQHANTLEPSALKYLLEDSAGGKKVESNLHLYTDLWNRVGQGQDVRAEATDAVLSGQLSKDDYNRITEKNISEIPNSFKRGMQYIQTAGKVSELEPDPAKTQTLANMQNDFQDFFRANPKATDKDVQAEAIDIVKRYQLVQSDKNLLMLPVPRFFVGTRAQPNVEASQAALVKAFQAGQVPRDDFDRQAALLDKWQAAAKSRQQ